jgi:hypothetical protein
MFGLPSGRRFKVETVLWGTVEYNKAWRKATRERGASRDLTTLVPVIIGTAQ